MSDTPSNAPTSRQGEILQPGELVDGRFEVVRFLAEGGMGQVYVATQRPLGRKVALKVMHRSLLADAMSQRRFLQEAVAVSKLDHPNTISVYDFGELSTGAVYMAMEFVEGTPLQQVIEQEGALPPERALPIAAQICESLAEAHDKGIVHRDLKPDNIFLAQIAGQRDFAKVLDFGIAKVLEGDGATQLTMAGHVCGTPEYMAPEQARGEAIDGRTDLYALGIMLWEMLMGETPYQAPSPVAMLLKHQNESLPPLPETIPASAREVVERLAAKSPSDRYGSAEEARDAILAAAGLGGATKLAMGALSSGTQPRIAALETKDAGDDADAAPKKEFPWWAVIAAFSVVGAMAFFLTEPRIRFDELPHAPPEDGSGAMVPDGSGQETATAEPEVPTEVAPTTAEVRVTSAPTGAEVYVDGRFVGRTEVVLDQEVGATIEASFRLPGHIDTTQVLVIEAAGDTPQTLHADLEHVPATLVITSSPNAADILIGGEYVCVAPCEHQVPWSDEPMQVTFSMDGREDTSVEVTPNAEQVPVHTRLSRGRSHVVEEPEDEVEVEEEPERDDPFRPVDNR